ncbi:MAG: pyridoxamine 5'-phosphate oxidase, partial [Clostridia bacterium]|nr:pyridoxamine 5'-phosphate oxidase [Clostridia bacterium]
FGTGTEKSTYKEFTANPQVEILAVSEGQFLRYDGTVVLVDDDELTEAVLAANPAIYTFINEEAGSKFAMFKLADGHAVLGSMKGHTEEFDV